MSREVPPSDPAPAELRAELERSRSDLAEACLVSLRETLAALHTRATSRLAQRRADPEAARREVAQRGWWSS